MLIRRLVGDLPHVLHSHAPFKLDLLFYFKVFFVPPKPDMRGVLLAIYRSSVARRSFSSFQIKTPLFESILTDELRTLFHVFQKNNYELKIAGGAVRDLLMEIRPHDVDLATNAKPDQMLKMFEQENIRVINLKGIKHGTLPVRINDKVSELASGTWFDSCSISILSPHVAGQLRDHDSPNRCPDLRPTRRSRVHERLAR